MIDTCSCNNDKDEVNVAEDDEYVFLDSCASKRLFILRDQSYLESFVYSGGSIQTTRAVHYCHVLDLENMVIG